MKVHHNHTAKHFTLGIASTLSLATILGVGIYSATNIVNNTNNANALSYSTNEDISFTFKPTLSISLSTGALTIDNLVPGTTSDSNAVTVTVASNTPYGYVLSAGVGSTESTDPYYNTSDLVHDNTTTTVPTTNKFSSIATSASLQTLDTDNTWGYSTSTDGGTSWSTYSGLSHTATKPLLDISDPATPSTMDFKIAARSASTQASGTYNNVITFYAVGKPETHYLYEEVAKMSKGTQTATDLQEEITIDNSGVYRYNSSEFGIASDASNNYAVYYYRGIVDNSFANSDYLGNVGSSGDGTKYPNYVILAKSDVRSNSDTCWRIVRTTGSGGVKMIYNGTWTGSTCANAKGTAQFDSSIYDGNLSTITQIVRLGYTHNSTYAISKDKTATIADAFGSDSNPDVNDTDSMIKDYIEDIFYPSYLSEYTNILESSAGYCNDRSIYDNISPYNQLSEFSDIGTYYIRSAKLNFGAQIRNAYTLSQNKNRTITLNCPRSIVDLYTTADAINGNKQLSQPVSLLTADEMSFAGSGTTNAATGSAYSSSSYLRSGTAFWSLSPSIRSDNGGACGFYLNSGISGNNYVKDSYGVRPSISLKPGTEYASGSGTATDPWVVLAP